MLYAVLYIQGDSGGKISIFGGDSIGNFEKKIHVRVWCLVRNCYSDGDFESPGRIPLDFFLWGRMKSKVYKRRVDTPEELLACTSDGASVCLK